VLPEASAGGEHEAMANSMQRNKMPSIWISRNVIKISQFGLNGLWLYSSFQMISFAVSAISNRVFHFPIPRFWQLQQLLVFFDPVCQHDGDTPYIL
jgi:hypothetical protein